MFKLRVRMSLYLGKNFQDISRGLGETVLVLCDKYLDAGRTVVTDNYYTSVPFIEKLLERDMHLLDY